MSERIGIVIGWEESFPQAFIAKVNETPGFKAEIAKFGGTRETHESPYRVIVDRLSHEVPYYRFHLKAASLAGSYVINDPWWWSADEKFFGYSLAQKLGIPTPKTVVLPNREHIADITRESLRNQWPIDWDARLEEVGLPCYMKPAFGGGWKSVNTTFFGDGGLWDQIFRKRQG